MNDAWVLTDRGPDTYEQYQVPAVFEPLAQLILERAGLKPGEQVVDVACGTGIVARKAAAIVGDAGRIIGVDFNPGMLEVARRSAASEFAQIEWLQSDASELPVSDDCVDVVICQQGLQFFPNRPAAVAEMYRTLKPSGRVWLAVWQSIEHSPINITTRDVIERHLGPEIAKVANGPFVLGDANSLVSLLEDAGFQNIEIDTIVIIRHMPPPHISIPAQLTSLPIGPQIAALEESTRLKIVEEIAEGLSEYLTDEGMSVPQGTHIAMAKKP